MRAKFHSPFTAVNSELRASMSRHMHVYKVRFLSMFAVRWLNPFQLFAGAREPDSLHRKMVQETRGCLTIGCDHRHIREIVQSSSLGP